MAEEVERSRRALRMEWKLIRGRKEKLAWRTPCMFGTRLPCSGIHACPSPPIVVLGNGSPGHRCACPPAPSASHWRSSICWPPAPGAHRSTSHWQSSICWQPTFHIIFVAGKLLYGLRHRVPVAPSHTACFQGMSTCHQRPGLSTVCHKRQYFAVSYFF